MYAASSVKDFAHLVALLSQFYEQREVVHFFGVFHYERRPQKIGTEGYEPCDQKSREYRDRMEEIMDWFEENCPDYYKQVVFKLTPEMKLIQVAINTKQRETFVMTS